MYSIFQRDNARPLKNERSSDAFDTGRGKKTGGKNVRKKNGEK